MDKQLKIVVCPFDFVLKQQKITLQSKKMIKKYNHHTRVF